MSNSSKESQTRLVSNHEIPAGQAWSVWAIQEKIRRLLRELGAAIDELTERSRSSVSDAHSQAPEQPAEHFGASALRQFEKGDEREALERLVLSVLRPDASLEVFKNNRSPTGRRYVIKKEGKIETRSVGATLDEALENARKQIVAVRKLSGRQEMSLEEFLALAGVRLPVDLVDGGTQEVLAEVGRRITRGISRRIAGIYHRLEFDPFELSE